MRPIDADALVDMLQNLEDKLDKKAFHDVDFRAAYISGVVQEIKKRVIEAPTLDYAPVRHGEWIEGLKCSECGNVDWTKPNFCPNCGAKMDRGKENDTRTA